VSSESITGGSSLHSGILLCQRLTTQEITLMSPGDILFLYTDGVYDGSDKAERQQLESIMREHGLLPAKRHVPCIARIRCQTRRSSSRAHPSGTDGSE